MPPPRVDFDPHHRWQIDVNITHMNNVKAQIHNGTVIYYTGNATEVDFDVKRNYTFNTTNFNNVFLTFMADPGTDVKGHQASFVALVGLRRENISEPEDEDDVELPDDELIVPDIDRKVTYMEGLVMGTIIYGLIVFIIKWCCCPNRCKLRIDKSKTMQPIQDLRLA